MYRSPADFKYWQVPALILEPYWGGGVLLRTTRIELRQFEWDDPSGASIHQVADVLTDFFFSSTLLGTSDHHRHKLFEDPEDLTFEEGVSTGGSVTGGGLVYYARTAKDDQTVAGLVLDLGTQDAFLNWNTPGIDWPQDYYPSASYTWWIDEDATEFDTVLDTIAAARLAPAGPLPFTLSTDWLATPPNTAPPAEDYSHLSTHSATTSARGTPREVVYVGDGSAHFVGDNADQILFAGHSGGRILARGGHDRLQGGAGDDVLLGGAGNDVLYAYGGQDRLLGGAGDDLLVGGNTGTGHVLLGGDGRDQLTSQTEGDILRGGAGGDFFDLHGSGTRARGGDGDDAFTIIQTVGDGHEALRIWGGAGTDTFRFHITIGDEESTGADVILQDVEIAELAFTFEWQFMFKIVEQTDGQIFRERTLDLAEFDVTQRGNSVWMEYDTFDLVLRHTDASDVLALL